MTYRDDGDADRAQIAALERELDAARRRLEERGALRRQLTRAPETRATFRRYHRRYEIDAELRPERVREVLRTTAALTQEGGEITEVVADGTRSITWSGAQLSIEVKVREGRSTLTCTEEHASIGAIFFVVMIVIGGVLDAMDVASFLWRSLALGIALAATAAFGLRWRSRERKRARRRFDHIAALLDVEVPRALPAGPAVAAGDERAG